MQTVSACDERTLTAISRAIAKAALGRPVSFWFDIGADRRVEDGKPIEVPNGTVSFHLYVEGGARDHDVPARPVPTGEAEP